MHSTFDPGLPANKNMADNVDEEVSTNKSSKMDDTEQNSELFPGYRDVSMYAQQTLGKLMKATKASHTLPSPGDDYDFYSSYDSFREFCEEQGNHVLESINKLIRQQGVKGHLQPGGSSVSLDDKMDIIVETNDNLMERVGTFLDEASGITKPKESILPAGSKPELMVASWNRKRKAETGETETKSFRMMHAKNVSRPQMKFKDKVDNTNTPFLPIITSKPNALKPLNLGTPGKADKKTPKALADFIEQQRKGEGSDDTDASNVIEHPYQYELNHFEPIPEQLKPVESVSTRPIGDTPLTLVDSVEELEKLSKELKSCTEFAVDLEHHSYRSFLGFTCLMQISTGTHDYIVDTLELRSELHMLNESFTDPKIVKVFHGADMDIEWLQRDLGLYVVNMFDTSQASRLLGLPRHSLAYLLQHYCNVEADKQYQLADWRIRPLPSEMMKYAREDTHFLLYIYHKMKNVLLKQGNQQQNLLRTVLDRSKNICLKRYKKPVFTDESYMTLFRKNRKTFNKNQLNAFKLIYAWRDRVAREEDESTGYVLPNHMLFHISEELPREAHGVLACCTPIPPLLKQQVNEVHQLILKAKLYHIVDKSTPAKERRSSLTPTKVKTGSFSVQAVNPLESLTLCPHDVTDSTAVSKDITQSRGLSNDISGALLAMATTSTMFGEASIPSIPDVKMASPIITLFISSKNERRHEEEMSDAQKKAESIKASLANPFEKYLPTSKPSQIASTLLESDKISFNKNATPQTIPIPSNPMEVVWKLKPSTEPKKKTPTNAAPPVAPSPHRKWTKPDAASTANVSITVDADDETVPLRQQGQKRKPNFESPLPERPKQKRDKVAVETPTSKATPPGAASFEAYDYSKANMQLFEGAVKQGHGTKKRFDTDEESDTPHSKGASKSKNHPSSGVRSVVYGGGRSGGGGGRGGGWRGGRGGRGGGGRGRGRGGGRGGFQGQGRGGGRKQEWSKR